MSQSGFNYLEYEPETTDDIFRGVAGAYGDGIESKDRNESEGITESDTKERVGKREEKEKEREKERERERDKDQLYTPNFLIYPKEEEEEEKKGSFVVSEVNATSNYFSSLIKSVCNPKFLIIAFSIIAGFVAILLQAPLTVVIPSIVIGDGIGLASCCFFSKPSGSNAQQDNQREPPVRMDYNGGR